MHNDDSKRTDNPADKHIGQAGKPGPGDEHIDKSKTPGDGILQGSTPAGLTADELRRRAEDTDRSGEPGTG